jgi:hypothetical protein
LRSSAPLEYSLRFSAPPVVIPRQRSKPFSTWFGRAAWLVCVLLWNGQPSPAQTLESVSTPLTAWLDLRPAAPGAAPQSVPSWVESFDFVAARPAAEGRLDQLEFGANGEAITSTATNLAADDDGRARSVFRIHIAHPAAATDDLQVRVFFDDRVGGPRPRVTAWDELGSELLRSRPLGQGLGLPSSETLTVPMTGVNYLEIEAAEDSTQVRGVFLTWLTRAEVRQPADFAAGATVREPFQILPGGRRRSRSDSYLYGVVTASLQKAPLVLSPGGAPTVSFEVPLERVPMVAVISFQVLGTNIAAPPLLSVNGHAATGVSLYLPDLADPGYQGDAHSADPALGFRYTGWLRAQKVIPGEWLTQGLNTVTLQLSNGPESVAVRSVEVQLKYNWDKFDYVLSPD